MMTLAEVELTSVATAPIVLVANNFPPIRGGSASVYAALARYAAGRIAVLAPRINYVDGLPIIGWREHDRLAPFPILRMPLLRTILESQPRYGIAKTVFQLRDVVLRLRVTAKLLRLILGGVRVICIGELMASFWIIQLFRFFPGLRIVVYVHGEEITTDDSDESYDQIRRAALGKCDAIVVVSRFTKMAVEKLLGDAATAKVWLIENGVDHTRFVPGERSTALQDLYGIRDCFVYLSVCRLVEKKGIDYAIRAFAQATRGKANCRYLIVGAGPYADTLKAIAADEGIADRVIFTGQVSEDELVEHYRLGHVFVMPNRRMPNGDTEGFGLVFLEANSCGLPVIAGRDGGSTDAVQDGHNGLVVDGNSVAAIASAMQRLYESPALYDEIQRNALAAAREASWAGKTRDFLQVCGVAP